MKALLLFPVLFFYLLQALYLRFTARKKINKLSFSLVYCSVVFLISLLSFRKSIALYLPAVANGILYAILVFITMKALEIVDLSVFYPIKRLNNPLAAFLTAITFKETLRAKEVLSAFFALLSFFSFTKLKLPRKGLLLTFPSLLLATTCSYLSKLGSVNRQEFMVTSYAFSSLTLFFLCLFTKKLPKIKEIFFGFFAGIINFFAYSSFLLALSKLPGYLVFPVLSTNIVLVPLASHFIFGEKLTKTWARAFVFALLSYLFLLL